MTRHSSFLIVIVFIFLYCVYASQFSILFALVLLKYLYENLSTDLGQNLSNFKDCMYRCRYIISNYPYYSAIKLAISYPRHDEFKGNRKCNGKQKGTWVCWVTIIRLNSKRNPGQAEGLSKFNFHEVSHFRTQKAVPRFPNCRQQAIAAAYPGADQSLQQIRHSR